MTNKNSYSHYNKNLKEFARRLRNNSTLPEVIIWDKLLKRKQLRGYPFLRQRPIKNFIVDFFSKDLNLVIELDGEIHKYQKAKDNKRENEIRELGYTIIRFQNVEILNDLYNVQRTLEIFIDEFEAKNGKATVKRGRNHTT